MSKNWVKNSRIWSSRAVSSSIQVKYLSLSGVESLPLSLPWFAFLFLDAILDFSKVVLCA